MDRELPESRRGQGSAESRSDFPSTHAVVLLYSLGAMLGLVLAFDPALSSLQTTNCLLLSWLLAVGALGMSVFEESGKQSSDDSEDLL